MTSNGVSSRPVATGQYRAVGLSLMSRVIGAVQAPWGVDLGVGLCQAREREEAYDTTGCVNGLSTLRTAVV
jgi:hypothetical protein